MIEKFQLHYIQKIEIFLWIKIKLQNFLTPLFQT